MLSRIFRAPASVRLFSTTRVAMVDSKIGRDSFSEKERAQENVYVRKQEEAQLKKLREKLEEQKKTIADLEAEIKNHKEK
ncbi:uncharacterized protein LODBEIA_P25820 [Lodderomyces beijingensis]|uniref:ATPase inhibitor, mitochondrial n=1 Tax=Lodderomyces beijingensis TaxID=1775926 RepID=A0ABP0ZL31_9ASCO